MAGSDGNIGEWLILIIRFLVDPFLQSSPSILILWLIPLLILLLFAFDKSLGGLSLIDDFLLIEIIDIDNIDNIVVSRDQMGTRNILLIFLIHILFCYVILL